MSAYKLGGYGGMLPQKILKMRLLQMSPITMKKLPGVQQTDKSERAHEINQSQLVAKNSQSNNVIGTRILRDGLP